MSSEDYKESEMSKIVKRLMDEEGFEFGEAVKEAMEQTKKFESKADGGSIGIEVLFQPKMANGGRAGYVSGGAALKLLEKGKEGIESLYNVGKSIFSKGDDAVDLAKQEEIFRSGNITTDFLENVDDKVIKKFVETRDAKGPGGYGLYDSFDDMPNGLKAAELISRIKNADGGIDYEAAELFIGKKLKGNETVNELISMVVTEKKADGGRVGLFMGGPALEGPSLSIYDSMKAYGATDQAISDAIKRAGYELPTADSGTTTPPDNSNQSTTGGNAEGFSVYNPDPNRTRSFRSDPRVTAANEADIRNRTLTEMGIVDPFADEISLSGAYYGDMPEDTSNQIGKQSTSAKIMQGIRGIMDNPITDVIGFALNPAFGAVKGIAKGIGSLIPDQIRPTQENILGNLGIRVNDIGQIISTGDYDDESGDNVMAGYNVSKMTPETFAKRIASIQNRKAAQTDASRRRIAAIKEAQRKFELSQKLAQEQMEAKRQASIDALNKRKADAKAAGDAEKARKLQIQAAAKAQEISRRQAAQQQAAIERDQGRDRDRGGGANQSGSGYSSGSGYNEGNYCFDPNTLIQMADGSTKQIKNIQLGDDTKGGEVTGVFQFKASDEIHDYKGVTVAGSHYVKEDGKFIMVKDSPLSVKIDKIPVVYSLDTTGRRIFINDIEFADYNGDGVAKNFLTNAGVDLTGFDTEVLRQVEHRLI